MNNKYFNFWFKIWKNQKQFGAQLLFWKNLEESVRTLGTGGGRGGGYAFRWVL